MSETNTKIEAKLRLVTEEDSIPIDKLLKAVEGELIPRLMMSHLVDVPENFLGEEAIQQYTKPNWTDALNIEHFAQLCVDDEVRLMRSEVDELLENGVEIETVYIQLLAPAANHLGDRWFDDTLSFVDVHLGLVRLHQLISNLEFVGPIPQDLEGKSILVASTPGDQHTFSATMVADIFKRAGWQVSNQSGQSEALLLSKIESLQYAWVGFSLHNSDAFDALKRLIKLVRIACKDLDTKIVVGGDYFSRHPERFDDLGADLCVTDGSLAVQELTQFMENVRYSR